MEAIEVLDRAEISGGKVIVEYSRTESALAELREKYLGVVFDCSTTKGDKEARSARLELTTLRTSLEKKRKEFKAPALEFGKKIDAEAARVTGEILQIENPIDEQIKADEKRRADEKAERERIEAERIKAIKDKISVIRSFIAKCQGISAERIANGIEMVSKISTGKGDFAEFEGEALAAKLDALQAMRELYATTKSREEDAARVEAQRVENERIAEEHRIAAEKLAAQQAEINRKEAELKAEQERVAQEAARQAEAAEEARRIEREQQALAAQAAIEDAKAKEPEGEPFVTRVRFTPPQRSAPAEDDGARMKLGEINRLLAPISLTADGLAQLGFVHVATDKSAKLYRESDFPAICAALVKHITAASQPVAA